MTQHLPTLSRFTDEYEGFASVRVRTATEAAVVELELRRLGLSFQTKIVKHKKRGREFIVMLVDKHVS